MRSTSPPARASFLSPTHAYYSRTLPHDVPISVCALGALESLAHYLRSGRKGYAYLSGALAGLALAP